MAIVPRKMSFDFDPATLPRWWFADNPLITHLANGMHLVFPEGERFFIRSVRHYLDRVDDPVLVERARGFFLQEAQHGRQHALSFEVLEAHGYDVGPFLQSYEKEALPILEAVVPPVMRLSVTVALEHLTAAMGANALTDPFLDKAHPTMQALLRWHAAEEIEHKSVAFDVYQNVSGSYPIRAAGMLFAVGALLTFAGRASRMLIAQERLTDEQLAHFRRDARVRRSHFRRLLGKSILDYLRPGFHPDQQDNYHLAEGYLASIGRLAA